LLGLGSAAVVLYGVVDHRTTSRARAHAACDGWRRAVAAIGGSGSRITAEGDDGLVIQRALTGSEMAGLWVARAWFAAHPTRVSELVPALAEPSFVGLTESDDVLVVGRDMPFYGHGHVTQDDLFTRAGRASWLLHQVTGRIDEPAVRPSTNKLLLADAIKSWTAWFRSVDNGAACFSAQ
jgi:hypothetical protein